MRFFVGTSGWHYDHWKERFYPRHLPKSQWLSYYAKHFSTVELNNSFYRLPSEKAFIQWYGTAPSGFTLAVKGSRLITHFKKLKDVEAVLANFLGRARLMKDKLGPILFQLPPNFPRHDARLEDFLGLLPKDLEYAVEFRHSSWFVEPVYRILQRHQVAFCVISLLGFPCPRVVTAPFLYLRFHGSEGLYWGSYPDDVLAQWARWLEDVVQEGKAYVYFNNDAEAMAVYNAQTLRRLLE